jgi:hypothetical protein
MTYLDFEKAYDAGQFKPATKMGVMLVYQDYEPHREHTPDDVPAIVTVPDALTWKEFQANGMSWILDNLKTKTGKHLNNNRDKVKDQVKKYPNKEVLEQVLTAENLELRDSGIKWMVVFSGKILCFAEEVTNG